MTKILIVEDEKPLLEEVVDTLRFEGYEVEFASDGLNGLERVRHEAPDLIISDIMMPRLDGYGMLEELRSTDATAMIPFIFLTAKTEKQDMRKGIELGADDYLSKPFTRQELLAAVHVRLDRQTAIQNKIEKSLDQLRDVISYSLPHELRTPLYNILGFADLLRHPNTLQPDEVAQMGQFIYGAGQRLSHLIENYLLYSKLQSMPPELFHLEAAHNNNTLIEPAYLIRSTAEQIAANWKREADLSLIIEDVASLSISGAYLSKIIYELVDNAFKFSQPAQSVMVKAGQVADFYRISIYDQGRGMSAECIHQLGAYKQFNRIEHEQQGSGLGVFIAKRLCELHNGEFEIVSEVSHGTQIDLLIPVT